MFFSALCVRSKKDFEILWSSLIPNEIVGGIFQAQLKTTTRWDGILNAMTGGFEKSDRKFLEHVMYLMYLVLKPCWLIIILGIKIYIKSILSTKQIINGKFCWHLSVGWWPEIGASIYIFQEIFSFSKYISIFQEMFLFSKKWMDGNILEISLIWSWRYLERKSRL